MVDFVSSGNAIVRSVLSVENVHSGIEIRSVAPGGEFELAARAKHLFDRLAKIPGNAPNLDAWHFDSFFQRQAQLVVARDGSDVIGMACHHPDSEENIVVRSLAVDPVYSGMGLGSAMISVAVRHAPTVYPDAQRFVCSIRQMRDGKLNEASRRSFEKVSFALEPTARMAYLDGTYANRGKWSTAELDEVGAVYIRYRLMFSQAETPEVARAYLQEWSNAVLPIPQRLRIR